MPNASDNPQWSSLLGRHFPLSDLLGDAAATPDGRSLFNAQRVSAGKRLFIRFLAVLPYICGVGFIAALWVPADSPYAALAAFVSMVSVSGLIGFGTNWLAIKMLFRPVQKHPLLGQGLIPAQREVIIHSLARGMHTHILSQELILRRMQESGFMARITHVFLDGTSEMLRDAEVLAALHTLIRTEASEYLAQETVRQQLRDTIEAKIEENLDSGVKKLALQTYKRVSRADYDQAIERLIDQLPNLVVETMQKFDGELERLAAYIQAKKPETEAYVANTLAELLHRIDIAGLLRKQMAHFDEARLERMIWDATNEQLRYIQDLGTILGMLGGLLIWQPRTMAAVFVLLGAAIWGLDALLMRLQAAKNDASTQP